MTTAFLLGFIFAGFLVAFLVSAPGRARRLSRVLTAIADAQDNSQRPDAPRTSTTRAIAPKPDNREEDVFSGLMNMIPVKERKQLTAHMREVAHRAAKQGKTLEEAFRVGIQLAR